MNVILFKNAIRNKALEEFRNNLFASEMHYLASELGNYGFNEQNELQTAVKRAIAICNTAGITIKQNFKQIYISKNGNIVIDWWLSELGRKLVILNANTDNPYVARLQIELICNF